MNEDKLGYTDIVMNSK